MALLKITAADIKKLQALDNGWYGAIVKSVSDPTPNKAKDSVNIIVTFVIEGSDGKEIVNYFNSKMIAFIIPAYEAAMGTKIAPDSEVDPADMVGKKLDVKLEVKIFNNNPQNEIVGYLPYGTGKNQTTTF